MLQDGEILLGLEEPGADVVFTLRVALDERVNVKRVGQPISGTVIDPLYAYDRIVVAAGTVVRGHVEQLKRAKVETAALEFARASNPQDEIFVLNFADRSRIDVPFTSDARVLEAGISRVDPIGGTAMRDAIAAGEEYVIRQTQRDRKVLVVVTDGNDNASVTTLDGIRTPPSSTTSRSMPRDYWATRLRTSAAGATIWSN